MLSKEFEELARQINGMQPTEMNIVEALHALAEKAGRLALAIEIKFSGDEVDEKTMAEPQPDRELGCNTVVMPPCCVYRVGYQHNKWIVVIPKENGAVADISAALPAIHCEISRRFSNPVTVFDHVEYLGSW